jgi:hypothetical protein
MSALVALGCAQSDKAADAIAASPVKSFFENRCFECHDADTQKGNLDLTTLPADLSDPATFARWLKVHDRIEAGEMPPKKKPRPDPKEVAPVLGWMSDRLIEAEKAKRVAGRATFRRLTRVEYENTLDDLFSLTGMPIRDDLPEDGSAFGFNKVSEALDISHVQMAKYMEVARRALDRATATRPEPPIPYKRRMYAPGEYGFVTGIQGGDAVLLKNKKRDPAFPLIENDTLPKGKESYYADAVLRPSTSAVGTFRHTDDAFTPGFKRFSPLLPGRYKVRISVWSFWWDKGQVLPSKRVQVAGLRTDEGPLGFFDAPSLESKEYEVETWLEPNDMILFNTSSLQPVQVYAQKGRAGQYQGPGIAVDWLEVEGPINNAWRPASHVTLFGDLPLTKFEKARDSTGPNPPDRDPPQFERRRDSTYPQSIAEHGKVDGIWTVASKDPGADAKRLLASFLPKAFRRPVQQDVVERYAGIVRDRIAAGDCFEDAMKMAYETALCSPEFLFRIEPQGTLDDYSVANRLSYFLWNTMPDEELLALAASGRLKHDQYLLRTQARRMLADPRSDQFINDFLDQWLALNEIGSTTPDKKLYPEFKPYMQDSMVGETRAFFRQLIDYDLGISNLVDSDFAMLNTEVAQLYGIPGVPEGNEFSRVFLPEGTHRGGILTQASVLKVTANGTVTSPVKRGAWVMDRLLGKRPDPPPPTVSAIDPDLRGTTTIRQQLDKHRSNPSCAACHAKMDPPGFALESFDVIGQWRDRYRSKEIGDDVDLKVGEGHTPVSYKLGMPVDCTGQTVDGASFKDINDFRKLLLQDERQLARNFLRRLTVYATGAEVGFEDRQTIEKILDKCGNVSASERSNFGAYRMRTMIEELVASDLFLHK